MVPSEFTQPEFFAYAIGVLIQLAAALWVFSLGPGDQRHRSFAVLVTLNAVWDLLEGLFFVSQPPRDDYYFRVYTYLAVWSAAALVWFLSLYPRRLRSSGLIGWAAIAVAAIMSVWFALDHSAAETPPFVLVSLGWSPLLTLGAFLVLRTPSKEPADPRSWSMVLVASAFLVYPLSQAATLLSPEYWSNLRDYAFGLGSVEGFVDGVVEFVYLASRIAALVLAGLALSCAGRQPGGAGKEAFIGAFLGAVVLSRVLNIVGIAFLPINAVVFGIVITYALARARLFDIDLRLKLTLSRGTILAAFTFVFYVVSQLLEEFFEQGFGQNYLLAGLACGLLLFALSPLQHWAERLADRALPSVKKTPDYTQSRKQDMYLGALADVWEDGHITVKERRLLDTLAEQLGIDRAQAALLEMRVVKSLPSSSVKLD